MNEKPVLDSEAHTRSADAETQAKAELATAASEARRLRTPFPAIVSGSQ